MPETAPTIRYDIYMAGDIDQAKQVCREYCYSVGFCVHIEPVDYIYTAGEEAGFKVGIINYPRFPAEQYGLEVRASELASRLAAQLCQRSYTIVGPNETTWVSIEVDAAA